MVLQGTKWRDGEEEDDYVLIYWVSKKADPVRLFLSLLSIRY